MSEQDTKKKVNRPSWTGENREGGKFGEGDSKKNRPQKFPYIEGGKLRIREGIFPTSQLPTTGGKKKRF